MDEIFDDNERLYRAIRHEYLWNHQMQKPEAGSFQNSAGASVERDGNGLLNISDAIEILQRKIPGAYAVVYVLVCDCKRFGVVPVYKPTEDDIYHSEIHDLDTSQKKISKIKATQLALKSTAVYVNCKLIC